MAWKIIIKKESQDCLSIDLGERFPFQSKSREQKQTTAILACVCLTHNKKRSRFYKIKRKRDYLQTHLGCLSVWCGGIMSKKKKRKVDSFSYPSPIHSRKSWNGSIKSPTRDQIWPRSCVFRPWVNQVAGYQGLDLKYGKPFKNGAMMELRISCHQVRVLNSNFFFLIF